MGKAVIVSEQGEGLYTIRKEVAGLEQARAMIAEQRAKLEAELPDLRAEEEAAKIETAYRRFLADSLADDWASGIDIPEESLSFDFGYTFDEQAQAYVNDGIQGKVTGFEVPEAVLNAIHTLVEARMKQDDITRRLNEKSAQYLALLKRQFELTALDASVKTPVAAWCADYTEGLTGTVATLEVPGEVAPTLGGGINIKPAAADDAAWNANYGQIQMGSVISPAAFVWNLTMITPWMKWLPLWRYATVDAVDQDNDTVNVTPGIRSCQKLIRGLTPKDLTLNAPWVSKHDRGSGRSTWTAAPKSFEVGNEVLLSSFSEEGGGGSAGLCAVSASASRQEPRECDSLAWPTGLRHSEYMVPGGKMGRLCHHAN
jgi:hypothetical protein